MRRQLRRYWPALAVAAAASAVLGVYFWAARPSPQEVSPTTNPPRVEEGLSLGGILAEPPPGTQAVLNVCETKDPYRAEVHRWEPIPDGEPAPSLDWLREQVEFI